MVELEVKYKIEKKIPQKIDISNKLFREFIRVEDIVIELEILNKLPEKDRIIYQLLYITEWTFLLKEMSGIFLIYLTKNKRDTGFISKRILL